jgi:hypothetical protein
MARALGCLGLAAIACGGSRAPLAKAGDNGDEGAGDLARQSVQLAFGRDDVVQPEPQGHHTSYGGPMYGGDPYGGSAFGGDPYGGTSYAGWTTPQWSYSTPNRSPHYNIAGPLSGELDGKVTWTGPLPGKLSTACGSIENPTLHVGSDHGVRGVIVYIEKVSVGRQLPYYGRPATVGGVVAKHGCALLPAAQIVTPLPTAFAIHGDTTRARIRVTTAGAPPRSYELQEAGQIQLEARAGLTQIDGEDGKLVAAWVLALDSPYYAITDEGGRFRIGELATGTYDIAFWQPPLASTGAGGALAYSAATIVHRTVKIENGKTARLDVALPARYLAP